MTKIIGYLFLVLIINTSNINICSNRFDQTRFNQSGSGSSLTPQQQEHKEQLHIPAGGLFAYSSHKKKYKAYNSTDKQHMYLPSEHTNILPLAIKGKLVYQKNNNWCVMTDNHYMPIKNMDFNVACKLRDKKAIYAIDNQNIVYYVTGVCDCLEQHFPQEPFATKYPKVFQFIKGGLTGTVIGLSLVAVDHYSSGMIAHVFSQIASIFDRILLDLAKARSTYNLDQKVRVIFHILKLMVLER